MIAIVTPSYGQVRYLRQAVDSVLSQSGVPLSYAVFDGGSTDGSVEVLRSYGDTLRWKSGSDGGQVRAINAGLQELPGHLCGYLNSDDFLSPDALQRVGALFQQHHEVDVIYGRARVVDEAGRLLREYPTLPYNRDHLVDHCFICQPACFWRRRMHDRFGWFDVSYDNTFDYEFWLRLAAGGATFMYLPELLASSREHPATKTQMNRGRIFAEIRRMQMKHLGYVGRNWWEQQLRYWRDESSSGWGRLMPGKKDERMYRLAWWPYVLWRRRLGGPLFARKGDWRA